MLRLRSAAVLAVLVLLFAMPARALVEEDWASAPVVERAPINTITITAVGDVTIGADPRKAGISSASQKNYEYMYDVAGGDMLKNARAYFERKNEITVINLESSFTKSSLVNPDKSYTFRANPKYADILSEAGVDVVGHANNHSRDFENGARDTHKAVIKRGIKYAAGSKTAVVTRNHVTVGFAAFNTIQSYSTKTVKKTIAKLNKKCDVVVASFHWGDEYSSKMTDEMKKLGRMAVDTGADLVLGHHQHVVSGVEKYKGRYIFYGLGTFSSTIKSPEDTDALMASVTFDVDSSNGKIEDTRVELTPFRFSTDPDENDGVPIELTGDDRSRVLDRVWKLSSRLPATLPEDCFT